VWIEQSHLAGAFGNLMQHLLYLKRWRKHVCVWTQDSTQFHIFCII